MTFESNSRDFARNIHLSYAYVDILLSVPWLVAAAWLGPAWTVFLPGVITGIGAVLVDYVWFYRSGRRKLRVAGAEPTGFFLLWWLIGWFEFLIAFNMGVYVGWVLHVGLLSVAGLRITAAFLAWYWVLTPVLSRAVRAAGIGTTLVSTTRQWGGFSYGRIGAVVVLFAVVWLTHLSGDPGRMLELFVLGMLAAAGMELPLYVLKIRPGADAWKALVLNTLVEWNYATPILFMLLHGMGAIE